MITNATICEIEEIYSYAESEHGIGWNVIIKMIYDDKYYRQHRHFFLNTFVVTENFFNEEYMDDAYGLSWNPEVRKVVEGFMAKHNLKMLVIVTCRNHSLLIL